MWHFFSWNTSHVLKWESGINMHMCIMVFSIKNWNMCTGLHNCRVIYNIQLLLLLTNILCAFLTIVMVWFFRHSLCRYGMLQLLLMKSHFLFFFIVIHLNLSPQTYDFFNYFKFFLFFFFSNCSEITLYGSYGAIYK